MNGKPKSSVSSAATGRSAPINGPVILYIARAQDAAVILYRCRKISAADKAGTVPAASMRRNIRSFIFYCSFFIFAPILIADKSSGPDIILHLICTFFERILYRRRFFVVSLLCVRRVMSPARREAPRPQEGRGSSREERHLPALWLCAKSVPRRNGRSKADGRAHRLNARRRISRSPRPLL